MPWPHMLAPTRPAWRRKSHVAKPIASNAVLERNLVAFDLVDKAKGEADSRDAACRAATQNIKVAEARIAQAQAMMERMLLRAPFDGIVAEINGELGEFVTPSPVGIPTPPAVDVVDTSCIYVTAPIDEVDAPRIREGMPARVTLDAFRDRAFPGARASRRALRARPRKAGAHGRDRSRARDTSRMRPAARLQRRRGSGPARSATMRCAFRRAR